MFKPSMTGGDIQDVNPATIRRMTSRAASEVRKRGKTLGTQRIREHLAAKTSAVRRNVEAESNQTRGRIIFLHAGLPFNVFPHTQRKRNGGRGHGAGISLKIKRKRGRVLLKPWFKRGRAILRGNGPGKVSTGYTTGVASTAKNNEFLDPFQDEIQELTTQAWANSRAWQDLRDAGVKS